jgi:hypothetical protein
MKWFSLIALGTLVFLSSEGRCQDDESSYDSDDSCSPTLPMQPRSIPVLGSQSVSPGSPFDDLILNGRPGGFSPHIDHLGDLFRRPPLNPSEIRPPLLTRGTTFYVPHTSDKITFPNK